MKGQNEVKDADLFARTCFTGLYMAVAVGGRDYGDILGDGGRGYGKL